MVLTSVNNVTFIDNAKVCVRTTHIHVKEAV